MNLAPGGGIPQFRAVAAHTGEDGTIRTKPDTFNRVHMCGKGARAFPGADIPDGNGTVLTSTGEDSAIRTESYANDRFHVPI